MRRLLESRTPRERALMAVAAALVLALGLTLLVYRPLADARHRHRQAWESAAGRLAQVETQAAEIVALRKRSDESPAAAPDSSLRSLVGRTAQAKGLTVSRLAPGSTGALGVWFEAVEAPRLFRWIETLAERYGVTVAKASVSANDSSATVRAQLRLQRSETDS